MAGFQEASAVEGDTDTASSVPQAKSALTDSSSSRSYGQQRERGRNCSGGGEDLSQRWTRSQSPLRQLLSTASSATHGSPKNDNHGQGGGQSTEPNQVKKTDKGGIDKSDHSDGGGPTGLNPLFPLDFVDDAAVQGDNMPAEMHRTALSKDAESALYHEQHQERPQRQQQQQQRVCVKNVLRPVSYDECHIPSEEESADGGAGSDNGDDDGNGDVSVVSSRLVVSN